MSGFVKVSLIEASDLKLQRWTGDNAPYVTVRAVNLEAPGSATPEPWRSATALERDIGSRWQRGSNCKWRDAGCSFEYEPKLEQVAQVTVGEQRPRLEITCCDEQQGAADKTIGKGVLNLGMLLRGTLFELLHQWNALQIVYMVFIISAFDEVDRMLGVFQTTTCV